ncbi:MAG TPA: hypothetical protein VF489_13760 [Sphingobium sp.]
MMMNVHPTQEDIRAHGRTDIITEHHQDLASIIDNLLRLSSRRAIAVIKAVGDAGGDASARGAGFTLSVATAINRHAAA